MRPLPVQVALMLTAVRNLPHALLAQAVRPLRQVSIRAKVMLVPGAALLGFVIYALFSVMVARSNAATLEGFSSRTLPVLNGLSTARAEQVDVRALFTQALSDSDEFLVEDAVEKSTNVKTVLVGLAGTNPELKSSLNPLIAKWDAYVKLAGETVTAQIAGEIQIEALQEKAQAIQVAYADFSKGLAELDSAQQKAFTAAIAEASRSSQQAAMFGIALVVVLAVLVILASIAVDQAIRGPIETLRRVIGEVSAGRFSVKVEAEGKDAIAMMCRDFSALLGNLNAAIAESNQVLGAVARGDFTQRVQADLPGDLATLKQGVNAGADSVARTMHALDEVMDAIARGDFAARMDASIPGESRGKVDAAMSGLQSALGSLRGTMAHAAAGDFTHRIELDLPGELDDLKQSVNRALASLDEAFTEIHETTAALAAGDLTRRAHGEFDGAIADVTEALNSALDHLQDALRGVAMAADEVGAGAREIADGNADLSSRTERQAIALESSAASVGQLVSAVQASAENSRQTRQITRSAHERARDGADVVRGAVTAMASITDATRRIADIIGLIDSIAFQTNLLSLNAAVEAARAGEQGRGFAVVAAEVRTLAQRTTQSAKDIRQLIATAGQRVDDGNRLVTRSGQSLEEMAGSSEEIAVLSAQASDSIEAQARKLHDVSSAISQLEESNLQNSTLVEEVAAASASLSDQAARLRSSVARFRLDAEPASVRGAMAPGLRVVA
ncbi:methyl-accepting chemotaxis protein [Lysobacter korlensis]|uniref:Methyl-accepting chemotaxis protein n=1 Tax=Lysobacter korlensis TaxID=553636 RepID=A0ABV6RPU9_9GAMM